MHLLNIQIYKNHYQEHCEQANLSVTNRMTGFGIQTGKRCQQRFSLRPGLSVTGLSCGLRSLNFNGTRNGMELFVYRRQINMELYFTLCYNHSFDQWNHRETFLSVSYNSKTFPLFLVWAVPINQLRLTLTSFGVERPFFAPNSF